MEDVVRLPFHILCVVLTVAAIGFLIRYFLKRRKKKFQNGKTIRPQANAEKNESEEYDSDFPLGV